MLRSAVGDPPKGRPERLERQHAELVEQENEDEERDEKRHERLRRACPSMLVTEVGDVVEDAFEHRLTLR